MLVKVALNKVDTRVLAVRAARTRSLRRCSCRAPQETERLCVFLMDKALVEMKARGAEAAAHAQKRCFETSLCSQAEGRAQTILTVFDLRGFKCAPRDGLESAQARV